MVGSKTAKLKQKKYSVHSDMCSKMHHRSIGAEYYFVTFTDDKSCYSWVYPIKSKDQVFSRLLEWKALVEKSSGKTVDALH